MRGSGKRRRSPARKVTPPRRRRPRRRPTSKLQLHVRQMPRLASRTARRMTIARPSRATWPAQTRHFPHHLLRPAQTRHRRQPARPRPWLRSYKRRHPPIAASAAGVAPHIRPRGPGGYDVVAVAPVAPGTHFIARIPSPRTSILRGGACAPRVGAPSRGARTLCTTALWGADRARACFRAWTRVCSARSSPGVA